jgi:hypothetical protein
MSTPKPRETCRNLCKIVSVNCSAKHDRNQRNHFLKEEANLVSPLARGHLLRSRHSSATPLGASLAERSHRQSLNRLHGFVRCQSSGTSTRLLAMAPETALSAPTSVKKIRKRRISPKIVQAVELLAKGDVRTQKQAAERVGVSEEWLSTMLGRDETRVLLEQTCRKYLRTGTVRATARLVELLDSNSSRTALEASKHVLGIGGISPPREGGVNISIGNDSPGYVVILRHRDDPDLQGDGAQIIDVTSDAENASAVVPAPSKAYSR